MAATCRPRHMKRSPACGRCPVVAGCAWGSAGRPEPDPAVGSHAVSRGQSRFEGSFRQRRAALLRLVSEEPQPLGLLDGDAVAALERDGLVRVDGDLVALPG